MQPRLAKHFDQSIPSLNLKIARGLAAHDLKGAAQYVKFIIESAFKNNPQNVSFVRCEPATALEEHAEYIKRRKSKNSQNTYVSQFDLAKSTKLVMKYYFKHGDKELDPYYLAIPYPDETGGLLVRGTRYNVTPVIADQVFSVGVDNVFTRLARAKVTFKKTTYSYYADNTLEIASVLYSKIYNGQLPPLKERLVSCHTPILLYVLCKMGFTKGMEYFLGFKPLVVREHDLASTLDKYPANNFVVCKTQARTRPRTCRMTTYTPTDLVLLIPPAQYTQKTKNVLASFYYILDHFPEVQDLQEMDDTAFWRRHLGYSLFNVHDSVARIMQQADSHMASLDNYIDMIVTEELRSLGFECEDIYTFFSIIFENFSDWMLEVQDKISSMYDKKLSILYWVLLDITSAIFNLYFKLTAGDKVMSTEDVKRAIAYHINTGLFYMLASGTHAELSNETTSSSCAAFKLTSPIVPQSETARDPKKGSKGRHSISLHDPSKQCDVSIMEVCSHVYIQKKEGTGRSKINPFVNLDETGRIIRRQSLKPAMDAAQRKIKEH